MDSRRSRRKLLQRLVIVDTHTTVRYKRPFPEAKDYNPKYLRPFKWTLQHIGPLSSNRDMELYSKLRTSRQIRAAHLKSLVKV